MPRLSYGSSLTGRIDEITPELLFAFYGQAGDKVTVALSRADGDLDAVLFLLDENQDVIAQDDDSGGNQNALLQAYSLPSNGLYYIRSARYSGTNGNTNTQGSFILVLAQVVGGG